MIAENIRVPGSYNEVDDSGANSALPAWNPKACIVAPRLKEPSAHATETVYSVGDTVKPATANGHWYMCVVAGTSAASAPTWPTTGTVTDGTATWQEYASHNDIIAVHTPTKVYSAAQAANKAGAGSVAHRMAKAMFEQYEYCDVTLDLVDDDATGVAATMTLALSGTATEDGSAAFRYGADKITVSWSNTDTAATIAAALAAEINKYHDLPFVAAVSTATVTLVAKNAGTPGNFMGKYDSVADKYETSLDIDGSGVAVAITGWASGANDPDLSSAFDAIVGEHYHLFPFPWVDSDQVDDLITHLRNVSDSTRQRGARAWVGFTGAYAGATTLAAKNYERYHVAYIRKARYPGFELAAQAAAEHVAIGHPTKPLNNRAVKNCDAPDIADRFTVTEMNNLLWAGVTPLYVGSGEKVRFVRSITAYTLNAAGSPDPTWLDTTTIATIDHLRESVRVRHLSDFSGKNAKETHADGDPDFVITPEDVRSVNIDVCVRLEKYGSLQNVEAHKDRFVSALDDNVSGRINSDIPAQVVEGAHVLANTIRVVS